MKIGLFWRSVSLVTSALILCWFSSGACMTIDEVVALALRVNPQVLAARARWNSAMHSIAQNYAPADPIFTYGSLDSPTNGIDHASEHMIQGNAAFQFPGKALLQAESAKRSAEIARLAYEAWVRDVGTRTKTQCYQLAMDNALDGECLADHRRSGALRRGCRGRTPGSAALSSRALRSCRREAKKASLRVGARR